MFLYLVLQIAYLAVFVSNFSQLVLQAAVDSTSKCMQKQASKHASKPMLRKAVLRLMLHKTHLALQVAYLSVFVSNLGQLVLQAAVDSASIIRPLAIQFIQLAFCFILRFLRLLLAPDGSPTHLHNIDLG